MDKSPSAMRLVYFDVYLSHSLLKKTPMEEEKQFVLAVMLSSIAGAERECLPSMPEEMIWHILSFIKRCEALGK